MDKTTYFYVYIIQSFSCQKKLAQNNKIAKACKWGYLNKQKNLHLPLITKEKMQEQSGRERRFE
jgi:hypothetical protein